MGKEHAIVKISSTSLERVSSQISLVDKILSERQDNYRQAQEYYEKGKSFEKSGDYQNAVLFFTKAIELNPIEVTYYTSRAWTYYTPLRKYQEAINDLSKAMELDKDHLDTYYIDRGRNKYFLGDLEGAINDCDKALELKPTMKNRLRFMEWYDRAHGMSNRYNELVIKQSKWKLID
jgi:tetratricopeptide (TPR) repeat protein